MGRLTSFGVALEAQHDLWGSVPSRGYIFSHVASILLGVDGEATSQAEIADLELAVCVDQQVSWLKVTMQHVRRVDIFQAAKNLVDEGLEVSVGQWLAGTNDCRKIALHQF